MLDAVDGAGAMCGCGAVGAGSIGSSVFGSRVCGSLELENDGSETGAELSETPELAEVGGENGGEDGAYGLFEVYGVLMECADEVHGGIAQRGAEIAMTKVLGRIEREGADAVRFEEAEGVRRYARKVLATSRRDAARRVAVERRYAGGVGGASARLARDAGGDREGLWAIERIEMDEWMDHALGADDAEILVAVAVEDRPYPELAAEMGVREGTLRTRFHRARARFAKPWSGEFGAVATGRSRASRADGPPRLAADEVGYAA